MLDKNDALLASERFVLKVVRLQVELSCLPVVCRYSNQVELESCLDSVSDLLAVMTELLDRAVLHLPSRHLFR